MINDEYHRVCYDKNKVESKLALFSLRIKSEQNSNILSDHCVYLMYIHGMVIIKYSGYNYSTIIIYNYIKINFLQKMKEHV